MLFRSPLDIAEQRFLKLGVVTSGDIVAIGFLGDGHTRVPLDNLVGAKADALARQLGLGSGVDKFGRLEAEEKGGVREDRAGLFTGDIHGVSPHCLALETCGVREAPAAFSGDTLIVQGRQSCLGIPRFAVVELDAVAQLEPPFRSEERRVGKECRL